MKTPNEKTPATILTVVDPATSVEVSETVKRIVMGLSDTYDIEVLMVRPRRGPSAGASRRSAVRRRAATTPSPTRGTRATPAPLSGPTIAGRIRELISRGMDDDAIWPLVKKEFNMPDNRRSYIAGQRKILASA